MKKTKIITSAIASVGREHLASGKPCQDVATAVRSRRISGVCLADGAGSASASHIGAEVVVDMATEFITSRFEDLWRHPDDAVEPLLDTILTALRLRATDESLSLRDLACTLLFCFVEIRAGKVRYVCGNLGDGAILMRTRSELGLCLRPENGEFANQTWFVTSREAPEKLTIISGECDPQDIPGWVLTTDGAAPFLYHSRTQQFAPAVLSLLEDMRTQTPRRRSAVLPGFLRNVIMPRAFDDCSLGVVQIDTPSRRVSRRPLV